MTRWFISLIGLALSTFAIVAISGPGRIDIEDGQARFEAGRNLIDHGDSALRDDRLVWNKFPGRDGKSFTGYRLPQIVVAAGCVAVSDLLGEPSEGRRHFCFSLHGAACASLIAVLLAVWFRSRGLSERASLLWAAAGIFTTPCWHYATSTFDEILTTLTALLMLVSAVAARKHAAWLVVTALAAGILFNCKPPIVALALPALALACAPQTPNRKILLRGITLLAGVTAGWIVMNAYETYKFPPEVHDDYERIIREGHPPSFFGNVPEAFLDQLVGPSSGMVWYCPTVVLIIAGVTAGLRTEERRVSIAYVLAATTIIGFISLLVFYKGGTCWGPRYLTPLLAAGWLFAPDGAKRLGTIRTRILLTLGFSVQLLGLTAIPERLYVERGLRTDFYLHKPWWYFHPALGHVFNRPREIVDMLKSPPSPELTPAPAPTYTLPIFDPPFFNEPKGPQAIAKYQIMNGPRFWWSWMTYLPYNERPIDLWRTLILLAGTGSLGVALLVGMFTDREVYQNRHPGEASGDPVHPVR